MFDSTRCAKPQFVLRRVILLIYMLFLKMIIQNSPKGIVCIQRNTLNKSGLKLIYLLDRTLEKSGIWYLKIPQIKPWRFTTKFTIRGLSKIFKPPRLPKLVQLVNGLRESYRAFGLSWVPSPVLAVARSLICSQTEQHEQGKNSTAAYVTGGIMYSKQDIAAGTIPLW